MLVDKIFKFGRDGFKLIFVDDVSVVLMNFFYFVFVGYVSIISLVV